MKFVLFSQITKKLGSVVVFFFLDVRIWNRNVTLNSLLHYKITGCNIQATSVNVVLFSNKINCFLSCFINNKQMQSNLFTLCCLWISRNKRKCWIFLNVKKIKLATVVEGDQKAPFTIATTLRFRRGRYFFPWMLNFTLDPYLIMLSVKQGRIKYHF